MKINTNNHTNNYHIKKKETTVMWSFEVFTYYHRYVSHDLNLPLRFSAALRRRRRPQLNSPFLGASPRRAADGPRRMPRDPPARGQLPAQLQADQLQYPRHGGCGCSFNQCETRRSIKKTQQPATSTCGSLKDGGVSI